MTCKYFDCGWCYAPSEISTSATPDKKCLNPDACLYLKSQMTETDISKVLIEGEYATIMGVKYKRVEEPKPKMNFLFDGKFEIVSYNGENYYRLEYPTDVIWYKEKKPVDGMMLVRITGSETHRLLEGLWFNDVKKGKYDDEVSEPKPQTLYNRLYDELGYDFNTYIVDLVEDWLPEEHDTNSDGWNKCVRMLRENLR